MRCQVFQREPVRLLPPLIPLQAMYHKTFRWIVKRVNQLLGPKRKAKSATDKDIGILDIFGFECFDTNTFEQLLINLGMLTNVRPVCCFRAMLLLTCLHAANERLQSFFNNFIFKMEVRLPVHDGCHDDGYQCLPV